MIERKNIDKLFQEKFKDFEVEPPNHTWPELELRLKEKKNRKSIPFWWRVSGIAAALVIGFLLVDQLGFLNKKDNNRIEVVVRENTQGNQEQMEKTNLKSTTGATILPENLNSNSAIVGLEASKDNKSESLVISDKQNKRVNKIQRQNNIVNSNAPNSTKSAVAITLRNNDDSEYKNKAGLKGNNARRIVPTKNNQQPTIADGYKDKKGIGLKNAAVVNHNSKQNNTIDFGNQAEKIAESANKRSQIITAVADKNSTVATDSETASKTNQNQKNESKSDNNTIAIAVSEQKNQNKKLDSAAIATVVPNALEELLNEKESKVTKEPTQLNRWQITSNIAPIYFGSTSSGSPIDSSFTSNSKDYNTQVSYGIGATYAINKKFTLRTGINKVSLNYDTNNVAMYAGFDSDGLDNVTTSEGNSFLNFGKRKTDSSANVNATSDASAANSYLETTVFEGEVNQKMGYIEVPLEVSYSVFNQKFGLNVIAGISTLFLNENSVVVVSEGSKTNLGEANNLNATHFSTNIGLGLKYAFTKSLQANFEPIFKYQLNTFSRNSGDFKPYFLGLYTGLSFRF